MSYNNLESPPAPGRLTVQRAKQAITRWFFVPVALAIVGALIGGGAAAVMLRPTAEALVSLNAQDLDASSMARASETMVQEMRTEAVFAQASQSLGQDSDPQELKKRTRIAAVPSTNVISVQVVARGGDAAAQAAEEAAAIVNAVQKIEDDARTAELERVTVSIQRLMAAKGSQVSDTAAEAARKNRLGDALAQSQASVATMANQLTVVQQAREMPGAVGPLTLAVACGLGGALLGTGIALLLGARRGGVRSLAELASIHPNLSVVTPELLPDVLAVEGKQITTILVSGTAGTRDRLQALRDQIAFTLFSNPRQDRDLNLLAAPLSEAVVRRVTNDPSVIVVVGVDPATLRLEEVGKWLDRLPTRAYLTDFPGSV